MKIKITNILIVTAALITINGCSNKSNNEAAGKDIAQPEITKTTGDNVTQPAEHKKGVLDSSRAKQSVDDIFSQ